MYKVWSQKINKKIIYAIAVLSVSAAALFFAAKFNTAEAQVKGEDSTPNMSPAATFPGTNTGAIPDGLSGTPPQFGAPRTINFAVTGMTAPLTAVTVDVTLTHTWVGDVEMILAAPGGSPSLVTASRIGVTTAGSFGDSSEYGGTYTFSDAAAGTNIWTVATNAGCGDTCVVAAGSYRTTGPGQTGQTNPPPVTNLTATFSGLTTPQINGTWTLTFRDAASSDLGSVSAANLNLTATSAPPQHIVDMNGDGRTDFVVIRNTGGGPTGQVTWFINLNNSTTTYGSAWGIATDFWTPEDYDGDNKTDIAIWRPLSAGQPSGNAHFYILQSATSTVRIDDFGQSGDEPVAGDYDGDGKSDPAVYRSGLNSGDPSTWYYRGSLTPASITSVPWGQNGDFEAPGDYDGDGKNDFVIQRNNGGGRAKFWMLQTTAGFQNVVFGTPTDVIVPGDYDGDGKTDIATVRGFSGQIAWFVRPSSTGIDTGGPTIQFGNSATDFVAQGDYDGDGKTDFAIWRPSANPGQSAFWVSGSTGSTFSLPFGQNGDYPIANYNSH